MQLMLIWTGCPALIPDSGLPLTGAGYIGYAFPMVKVLLLAAALAQAAPVDPVAERERAAIQSVLERALQAQKAKDWDALRARLTPEFMAFRRWEAELGGGPIHWSFIDPEPSDIRIENLAVGPDGLWAWVSIWVPDKSSRNFDLFHVDGAWKLEQPFRPSFVSFRTFLSGVKALAPGSTSTDPLTFPLPATPRLDGRVIDASALPSGWTLTRNREDIGDMGTWPPIAEIARFNAAPGPGQPAGVLTYLLFHDAMRAKWYFWRETRRRTDKRQVERPFGDEIFLGSNSLYVRHGKHVLELWVGPPSLEVAERAVERIEAGLGSEALGTDTKAWEEAVKDGRFHKALRRAMGQAVQRGRMTGAQFDAAPRSFGEASAHTSETGAVYMMQHVHVIDADGNARSPYVFSELVAGSSPDSAAKTIVEKLLRTPALLEGLGRQKPAPERPAAAAAAVLSLEVYLGREGVDKTLLDPEGALKDVERLYGEVQRSEGPARAQAESRLVGQLAAAGKAVAEYRRLYALAEKAKKARAARDSAEAIARAEDFEREYRAAEPALKDVIDSYRLGDMKAMGRRPSPRETVVWDWDKSPDEKDPQKR